MGIKEDIKEGIMEKEIIVKAISKKDSRSGPMMSLMDGESRWYSVFKSNVKDDTWDQLSALKEGDRADISWTSTVSPKDGKTYNNLTGFTKVLRPDNEPPMPGLPGETPPPATDKDTLISKQVCLKGGVEITVALIRSASGGDSVLDDDPAGQAMIYAKRLYGILRETW